MTSEPTPYDELEYPSHAWSTTYPGHLAALGRVFGIATRDPNECRVLELGCGDGGNLIPMGLALPGSEFVGVDLASTAIERGQAAAREVRTSNVELVRGDISEIGAAFGDFDYVVAHGVYSWVPEDVRSAVLRVIRERMRPDGLAFVSYNALPGDQIRGVVRQMMKMHTSHIADPARKVQQARGLLKLLAQVPGDAGETYRTLLQSQIGKTMMTADALLYHDDLAPVSQPFYFTEFMGAAQQAGLQFAFEAAFSTMSVEAFPENIQAILEDLAARNVVAKEQYLDFFVCRGFRQTVLCHKEAQLDRAFDAGRMAGLRFHTTATRAGEPTAQGVTYEAADGTSLTTADGLTVLAFEALLAASPRSLAFDDLANAAKAVGAQEREELAHILFEALGMGLVDVRIYEPLATVEPSERPLAFRWARLRPDRQGIPNVYHGAVSLDDASARVVPLLDGRRAVGQVAQEVGMREGEVEAALERLAKAGLLVG